VSYKRTAKATGTNGILDRLRSPSRIVRRDTARSPDTDIDADRAGEARAVSCFLRGSFSPYPRRLRQGTLNLAGTQATWAPALSVGRRRIAVDSPITSAVSRPADHREPGVKKGGNAFGVLAVPSFVVVECVTPAGQLDFVVPDADEQLVLGYFNSRVS